MLVDKKELKKKKKANKQKGDDGVVSLVHLAVVFNMPLNTVQIPNLILSAFIKLIFSQARKHLKLIL